MPSVNGEIQHVNWSCYPCKWTRHNTVVALSFARRALPVRTMLT